MRAAAEALLVTVGLARELAVSGERIDLTGLDNQVGQLCAGVLDLPLVAGRGLRAAMIRLGQETEALSVALRAREIPQP